MTTHITYGTWFLPRSAGAKGENESPAKTLQTHFIKLCFLTNHMACPFSPPNQDPSAYPQPTSQDLAGFWDLLQLNIEDVRIKFQDLQRLKDSGWRLPPEKKVRSRGVQTALVSQQRCPRAKMAVCRRVAQMVVPSNQMRAVTIRNSERN